MWGRQKSDWEQLTQARARILRQMEIVAQGPVNYRDRTPWTATLYDELRQALDDVEAALAMTPEPVRRTSKDYRPRPPGLWFWVGTVAVGVLLAAAAALVVGLFVRMLMAVG